MDFSELIDLSHPIIDGMMKFDAPWHDEIHVRKKGEISLVGRNTTSIDIGSHSGTHMDAPLHFISNGISIDNIPLDKLIGPVSIIDLSEKPENYCVTSHDLENHQLKKIIILKYNWCKKWGSFGFYQNYPYLSHDAAEFLAKSGVQLLAMDTPSPDASRMDSKQILNSDEDSPIHKFLLNQGVIIVEYLANLDKIHEYNGWNGIFFPLKIQGSDGSPIRACIFKG